MKVEINEKLIDEICKKLGIEYSIPENPEDAGIYIADKKMSDKDILEMFTE